MTPVLILLALLLGNGLFAMAEIAIVSARKVRLQQRAAAGDKRAQQALALMEAPEQFLSTVQIGITLVGIVAGAFSSASFAEPLARVLARIPWLSAVSQSLAYALIILVTTYLSLVLGELVPKQLALHNPEAIARTLAPPMLSLSRATAPLAHFLTASAELLVRLLGSRPSAEPPITEEELKALVEEGTEAGVFALSEQDMISNVFRLGDRRVDALMTPRMDIVWLDVNAPLAELQHKIITSAYSRFPVCDGDLDHVLGIARAKDMLAQVWRGEALDLRQPLQQPLFVPETLPAARLLELFKTSSVHIALVLDEYGGTQGLLTLKDVLEALVGDIPPGTGYVEPSFILRADGSWLVDGMTPMDEVVTRLKLPPIPEQEQRIYQTLAGFVMRQLNHVPHSGESFIWQGWRFEVVDMDGLRVDKVLVSRTG